MSIRAAASRLAALTRNAGVLAGGACSTRAATASGILLGPLEELVVVAPGGDRLEGEGVAHVVQTQQPARPLPEVGRLGPRERGQRRASRAEPGQEVDVVAAYRCRYVEP